MLDKACSAICERPKHLDERVVFFCPTHCQVTDCHLIASFLRFAGNLFAPLRPHELACHTRLGFPNRPTAKWHSVHQLAVVFQQVWLVFKSVLNAKTLYCQLIFCHLVGPLEIYGSVVKLNLVHLNCKYRSFGVVKCAVR